MVSFAILVGLITICECKREEKNIALGLYDLLANSRRD